MDLYEKYMDGETELTCKELLELEDQIYDTKVFFEVDKVLTEIFSRVAYNSEIIFKELKDIHYCFWSDSELNRSFPIRKPPPNSNNFLTKVEFEVKQFGHIPLSLSYFYSIVGSLNFTWNYEKKEEVKWPGIDPLQIIAIDDLYDQVTNKYWKEEMLDYLKDEDYNSAILELSGDYLHKDNISGGPPYSIKITKKPSIDSLILNLPDKLGFIDYLRICFENCGFYRVNGLNSNPEFIKFVDKVKPNLKKI